MSAEDRDRRSRRDFEDEDEVPDGRRKRPRIDSGERDEYDEWKLERGKRGRKRKDKAGGRHRQRDRED